jgi:hypothetical protein
MPSNSPQEDVVFDVCIRLAIAISGDVPASGAPIVHNVISELILALHFRISIWTIKMR